jgi:hypothetical protein
MADLNARTHGTVMDWRPVLAADRSRDCDGRRCAKLGDIAHPPHGTAFVLGCGVCQMRVLRASERRAPRAHAFPHCMRALTNSHAH